MTYSISLISPEETGTLSQRYLPDVRYEIKSEIYGCCIKLLCDDHTLRDTWEDNFYSMSQNVRSHGRLFVQDDPDTRQIPCCLTRIQKPCSCSISGTMAG